MNSSSQKFRVSEIEYSMEDQLAMESLNLLYGKSIWFVDENSFEQIYDDNPDIKNLNITKRLPNKLIISVELIPTTGKHNRFKGDRLKHTPYYMKIHM